MRAVVLGGVLAGAMCCVCSAAPTPAPNAVQVTGSGGATVVVQSASGPGTILPNLNGRPDDPQTPYEFFTGTPGFTGTGAQAHLNFDFDYQTKGLRISLTAGAESYGGSGPNVLYLGETMLPTANPFESSRNGYFQSYLGLANAVGVNRTSILSGTVRARNDSWYVTGGWFLPEETVPFVFSPPPLVNVPPAIAPQLPETLATQTLQLATWSQYQPALPLSGVEAGARTAKTALEFFDAALPTYYVNSVFNHSARVDSVLWSMGRSGTTNLSVQAARLAENNLGGFSPITAGVLWGGGEETGVGAEGPEPESDIFSQRSTTLGVALHTLLRRDTSLIAEIGRSWFSAQHFSKSGQPTPGGYYHLGVRRTWKHDGVSLDAYRFEPTYAPAVLPYGNLAAIWPVAWSWPSNWLKFYYQSVANNDVSINRQGARVRYDAKNGHFAYAVSYAQFVQVAPFNATTAFLPGFTDPFFTSRDDALVSYRGTQKQGAARIAWSTPWLTASLDAVEDWLDRPAPASNPEQAVRLDVPQYAITLSHSSDRAVYAIGEGRFDIAGCYALCGKANVEIGQRVYFTGANFAITPRSTWLLEWRRYITDGLPFADFPVSPAYTGTRIIVEERFTFSHS